ncbi:MAG: hypothetical protein KME22_06590 [Hassallia sp. WJT32-NPBG1]|nr:hypothetical protein [Hassallia sp. WJT32-NPBG1]
MRIISAILIITMGARPLVLAALPPKNEQPQPHPYRRGEGRRLHNPDPFLFRIEH